MNQREMVKQLWREAGLYDSKKSNLQAFLKHFDEHPEKCWDVYAELIRQDYEDIFNYITTPLQNSEDQLLRLNIIRRMDPKKRRELNQLKSMMSKSDLQKDELLMMAIANLEHKSLIKELNKRTDLTSKLRRTIESNTITK